MHDIFFTPYIIPLGAFVVGIAVVGISAWHKLQERKLTDERELRQLEMEHQLKMKAMDLEMVRLKTGASYQA